MLVDMAKHEYHAMVKCRAWLVKFPDRKADIVLSFCGPRDWGIKEGLVSDAEEDVIKSKNKGVLKLTEQQG